MAIKVRKKEDMSGWKVVEVVDVYVKEDQETPFGLQDRLTFELELPNGKVIERDYNFTLYKKGALYPIAKDFFGRVHDELDFAELIGTTWNMLFEPHKEGSRYLVIKKVEALESETSGII